jgi:hypothetical protein
MNKIAHTKVAEVLAQVAPTMRAQQATIEALTEKVAHYEKQARVHKLANEMQAKNLNPESSLEDKVDSLMGEDDGKLDVIEQAINMSAPQVKLAALSDHPGIGGDAHDQFVAAIMSDD